MPLALYMHATTTQNKAGCSDLSLSNSKTRHTLAFRLRHRQRERQILLDGFSNGSKQKLLKTKKARRNASSARAFCGECLNR